MDDKRSVLSNGEARPVPGKQPEVSVADDHRAAVRQLMETELKSIIRGDIKAAVIELADEERRAIREAVEEHKRAIRDVLEQEKLAIRAKKEALRESILGRGMG